eukprot:CAMPEP_0194504516 /NCGR_PEP_ID=MMETSP0253-20130528/28988_1 /TAXON_ID=2966 /ORGANISM="Noctiluca scintillans" /LENGTH=743 /DNA_ID=CAMNT_0039346915 /DNA_START=121 /DNA_END=2352 /DNA_ORIENTATION=-
MTSDVTVCIWATLVVATPAFYAISLFSQISPLAPAVLKGLVALPKLFGVVDVYVALSVLAIFFILVHWKVPSNGSYTGVLVYCLAAIFTICAATVGLPHRPFVATAVLVGVGPVFLRTLTLRHTFRKQDASWFRILCMVFGLVALVSFLCWTVWLVDKVVEHQEWTAWQPAIRELVRERTITWKAAFVTWCMPFGVALELGLMALMCWMRSWGEVDTEEEGNSNETLIMSSVNQLMMWGAGVLFIVYLHAAMHATGEQEFGVMREDMTDEVVTVAFWVFVALAVWTYDTLGIEKLHNAVDQSMALKEIVTWVPPDWARAMLLMVMAVPMCLFAGAQVLLDKVCGRQLPVPSLLRSTGTWEWTSVFTKALWLGVLYVVLAVGVGKVFTVGLSVVNEQLSQLGVVTVSVVMFCIALGLFLCPVSPGTPIYMVMGIVLVASGRSQGWSFNFCVLWATLWAYVMKLTFTVVAQKCIGEPLSTKDAVRRLCGVHTPSMRAVEEILKAPGITIEKVSILVGMPDWPVAVLCGILRVPVFTVVVGISPVLVQSVFPSVLAGALLIGGDNGVNSQQMKTFGQVTMVIAFVLQLAAGMLGCYFVERVIAQNYERLSAIRPEDERLVEMDRQAEAEDRAFWLHNAWEELPLQLKATLYVSFLSMEVGLLLFVGPWKGLGITCFKHFEVSDSVSEDLDGNLFSVINPMGWVGLACTAVACVGMTIFYAHAHRVTRNAMRQGVKEESVPLLSKVQ